MFYRQSGSTLTEVLISTSVFVLASMVLIFMFDNGFKSWRDVNAKSSAERYLNRTMVDMNGILRNSDISKISCGFDSETGNGVLICESNAKYDEASQFILTKEIDADFSGSSGSMTLKWPFKVAYFTCSESPCNECSDYGSVKICIHKKLIKRWYAVDEKPNVLKWSESQSNQSAVNDYISLNASSPAPSQSGFNKDRNDIFLASDVIYFKPSVSDMAVSYRIKALKRTTLTSEMVIDKEIEESMKDGLKNNSIAVSNMVYPLNNNSDMNNAKNELSSELPIESEE